jgi:hypothetical protein
VILGFFSSTGKFSILLGYDNASLVNQFPIF